MSLDLPEFDPPQDDPPLPHHTNVERVERRIFEIHVHWRHNAALIVAGCIVFLVANLVAALWAAGALASTDLRVHYFACVVASLFVCSALIGAQALKVASESIKRSDRNINALEEEIQRITSSSGYTLNNEVMPVEFYLKTLGLLRSLLLLLLPLWLAVPALLFFVSPPEPAANHATPKPASGRSLRK